MAELIYQAESGQHIADTACEAIKAGCDWFTHNDKLYRVTVHYVQQGSITYSDADSD